MPQRQCLEGGRQQNKLGALHRLKLRKGRGHYRLLPLLSNVSRKQTESLRGMIFGAAKSCSWTQDAVVHSALAHTAKNTRVVHLHMIGFSRHKLLYSNQNNPFDNTARTYATIARAIISEPHLAYGNKFQVRHFSWNSESVATSGLKTNRDRSRSFRVFYSLLNIALAQWEPRISEVC